MFGVASSPVVSTTDLSASSSIGGGDMDWSVAGLSASDESNLDRVVLGTILDLHSSQDQLWPRRSSKQDTFFKVSIGVPSSI
jgi:hypothetical protein